MTKFFNTVRYRHKSSPLRVPETTQPNILANNSTNNEISSHTFIAIFVFVIIKQPFHVRRISTSPQRCVKQCNLTKEDTAYILMHESISNIIFHMRWQIWKCIDKGHTTIIPAHLSRVLHVHRSFYYQSQLLGHIGQVHPCEMTARVTSPATPLFSHAKPFTHTKSGNKPSFLQ